MRRQRKFVQISAGSIGLYALDEAGAVWQYQTDPPGRNGRWIPLIGEADGVETPVEFQVGSGRRTDA